MSETAMGMLYVSNFLSAEKKNRGYCEDLADRLEARGWHVTRTSTRVNRLARLLDMLRTAWARRNTYELAVVDVFSGAAFVWAESVCFELRRLRKPYVITLHGGNLPEFAKRWPRRTKRLLESAVLVTAPSDYMRERMRDYRADIVLLRNAIDAGAYRFAVRATPRPRLVWIRAFHAIYNPTLAVDVLARVSQRFPETTLTMIGPDHGDGSLPAVEARARELRVHDRLEVLGRVPKSEIAGHLAGADVFINTTNIDNTPISVLEAMAAGLCVVSTSVGGIPFLLSDERNALLVPPRDPAAMSAAVERMLAEAGLAARVSRAAHELAVECDWTRVLNQWDDTLRQVVTHV